MPDRRTGSRGQSIVELALVLPVLLLLVLIGLDFGRAYLGWVVLNNAARVGADYAALHPAAWGTPGDPVRRGTYEALVRDARADAGGTLAGCDDATVPAPVFASGVELGDVAEVTLTCRFTPITPLIGSVIAAGSDGIAVSARSIFPIRTGIVGGPVIVRPPSCPALAAFEWSADGTVPLRVHFTDSSTGAPTGWLWDFGDGSTWVALEDPSHTYAVAGIYTVRLEVNACSSIAKPPVTVAEPAPTAGPGESPLPSATPAPSPTATPLAGCAVPNFIGTKANDAQVTWGVAEFSTSVIFDPNPNPNGNWNIQAQSLVGGQRAPCNVDITLGPKPLTGS